MQLILRCVFVCVCVDYRSGVQGEYVPAQDAVHPRVNESRASEVLHCVEAEYA